MSFFPGADYSATRKTTGLVSKDPALVTKLGNAPSAPGIQSPYAMDKNELANYRSLQMRKVYEGLGVYSNNPNKLGG